MKRLLFIAAVVLALMLASASPAFAGGRPVVVPDATDTGANAANANQGAVELQPSASFP